MEDISWLYNLHPVNFYYKHDITNTKQYGLIAEEVQKINPLLVNYNKNGEIKTVIYSKLITPMLKALQEQYQENIAQKNEIQKLKSEIQNLKEEINSLKDILSVKSLK